MKQDKTNISKHSMVESFALNAYVKPEVVDGSLKEWKNFGKNNSYFDYIKKCYDESPTNAGIINGFSTYLIGEGLIDSKTGKFITKILNRQDARLIFTDFKLYGQCAFQILWNDAEGIDKKPVKIEYIPVRKIGLNVNEFGDTNGYWYSFDWKKQSEYPPRFYHKFDGSFKGYYEDIDTDPNIEILVIRRTTDEDFFSTPDYDAGLVYADLEAQLATSAINHVANGFQGGAIINMNSGVPDTEELKREYRNQIMKNLNGVENSNKIIISFNENAEQAMTVERLEVDKINAQYESFDARSERKLLIAHSAPYILFGGDRAGGGLGSNSEEMIEATKSLFRRYVYPSREVILDGLQSVFDLINPEIILEVKDFEELVLIPKEDEATDIVE